MAPIDPPAVALAGHPLSERGSGRWPRTGTIT